MTLATRDCDHGLAVTLEYCNTPELQREAVAAVQFKCNLLWSQLDALYYHFESPTRAVLNK
jgi:pyrroloquinoline-quinone synthase/pyrroloquinoline quinone biosynthesis protein D